MLRKLTPAGRRTLADARAIAASLGSPTLEAEHLLLAVASRPATAAHAVLVDLGLDEEHVRDALDAEFSDSLAGVGVSLGDFDLNSTPDATRTPRWGTSATLALKRSARIAEARRDRIFTPGHILLGVLRAPAGTVPRALDRAGVDQVQLGSRVAASL